MIETAVEGVINIAHDFSEYPGGRYPDHGKYNGTRFREELLVPILDSDKTAEIVLDGTAGYPSSFLEEASGGLVRKGYSPSKVLSTFTFTANNPGFDYYVDMIEDFVNSATPPK